jgi:hypothetical protein
LTADPLPGNTCQIVTDRQTKIPSRVPRSRRLLRIVSTGKISS